MIEYTDKEYTLFAERFDKEYARLSIKEFINHDAIDHAYISDSTLTVGDYVSNYRDSNCCLSEFELEIYAIYKLAK